MAMGNAGIHSQPILFLHIPKTAGTAFLMTIHNIFGDHNVIRFSTEEGLVDQIAAFGQAESQMHACVNGHPPVYFWRDKLHLFRPFTILRDPIARVQSFFRFILREPGSTLMPWGMPRKLTFEEFITSRNRGLFEHVNNGMCRMLCGDPRFTTPGNDEFEHPERHPEVLNAALLMLEKCTFGLVEDMASTLRLVQAQWGIPFPLKDVKANTTERLGEELEKKNIQRIAELNALDIALYHHAQTVFRQRLSALEHEPVTPLNPRTIFAPALNKWTPASLIPGRQAFHSVEPTGVCWLDADCCARIHFSAPAGSTRLAIVFQCVCRDYPVAKLVVAVDGQPVAHNVWTHTDEYVTILTEPLPTGGDLRILTIKPPFSISMRVLQPNAKDHRFLSLALSEIAFLA